MSGEETASQSETSEQVAMQHEPARADWFLQNLVQMVNANGFGISISLHVGGFIVSGSLISGKHYFEELGAMVGDSLSHSPEMAESFQAYFSQPATLVYGAADDKQSSTPPSFIHLKDARFFRSGNQEPLPSSGVLWRGKLADVAGFFVGSLSVSKN